MSRSIGEAGPLLAPVPAGREVKWLLVTDGAPHRKVGGAALRWSGLERGLARLGPGERFALRCPCPQGHPRTGGEGLELFRHKFCPTQLVALTTRIAESRPSIVVFSGIELADYIRALPPSPNTRVVLDLHNAEALLCREMTVAMNASGTRVSDRRCAALADIETTCFALVNDVWTCTDRDRRAIVSDHPQVRARVHTVPNAVEIAEIGTEAPIRQVTFLGRLDWYPNTVAAHFLLDDVYPALAHTFKEIEFVIAGARPQFPVKTGTASNISVVADPVNVDPLWMNAMLVVPLTVGGGSRLKILEAFARGVPVVASTKAVEGLDIQPLEHYVHATTAAEFRSAVRDVLTGRLPVRSMCLAAHEFVSKQHGFDSVADAISTAFHRGVSRAS